MTPKEKAKELIDEHRKWVNQIEGSYSETEYAKKAALITIDEVIASNTNVTGQTINGDYWQEVKQEIQNL